MIRLRTTANTILGGELDTVLQHSVLIVRTEFEDAQGIQTMDPLVMSIHKLHFESIVVDAVTNGVDIMVDQAGLKAAHALALLTGHRIEIRTCAVEPADFAAALCEMEVAA